MMVSEYCRCGKDHPLPTLKAKDEVVNRVDRIKKLSVSKLEKLKEFMDGLEKEG